MGLDTYSWQWFCLVPNNQCKASRSHPSSVQVQSSSHKARNLVGCALFTATPGFSTWSLHFPEWSNNISSCWVELLLELDWSNASLDSARVPLRVRRCPFILPRPYPPAFAAWRHPSRGPWMWPRSSPYIESESERKQISNLGDDLTAFLSRYQRDDGIQRYL